MNQSCCDAHTCPVQGRIGRTGHCHPGMPQDETAMSPSYDEQMKAWSEHAAHAKPNNVIQFPVERTEHGAQEKAWLVYAEALAKYRANKPPKETE